MAPTAIQCRATSWFAAVLCIIGLTACPKSEQDDTALDGGAAGASGHGNSQGGDGSEVSAGSGGRAEAGHGGAAGVSGSGGALSPASSGAGGKLADDDAGVSDGTRCGTRGAPECGTGEFCNFEPDKDCGGTDRGGSCEPKPDVCDSSFVPVCGCDSRTYANDCSAHAAGISIKHAGPCTAEECASIGGRALSGAGATCKSNEDMFSLGETPTPQVCCVPRPSAGMTCGGIANLQCGADEFCNYQAGQGCDGSVADAAGKCEPKPDVCTAEFKPVCSCDYKTYGNACGAHSAGASVLHDGACTVSDCGKIGGRVAVGTGPAAMCNSDEVEHTAIVNDDGSMAIEGMLCCLKK